LEALAITPQQQHPCSHGQRDGRAAAEQHWHRDLRGEHEEGERGQRHVDDQPDRQLRERNVEQLSPVLPGAVQ
jgi:hypothetical protein